MKHAPMARSWIGAWMRTAWASGTVQPPIEGMLGGMRGGAGAGGPLTCATRSVRARNRALVAIVQARMVSRWRRRAERECGRQGQGGERSEVSSARQAEESRRHCK